MSNLERTTSLPARMDEMRGGEEDFTPRCQLRRSSSMPVAEGRVRSAREFPPPLGSLARKSCSGAHGQILPLTRLKSVRSNGRIVLREVKIENQMTLHTVRHQGRLVLNLVRCKENVLPPSSPPPPPPPPPSKAAEIVNESTDDHRIEKEEESERVALIEKENSKFRADHAHVLKELMAACAARVVKQMSCNRPVVWDHSHHFHCVTTSS